MPAQGPRPSTAQLALEVASSALEIYAANPALRAVLTAVPLLGGSLDALAGTAGGNIALERLRILLEEIGARVDRLEETNRRDPKVSVRVLIDPSIRAIRGAIETSDRAKVRMIASVLVGATSRDRPKRFDAESVLASLISLTPADLAFARRLADSVRDNRFAYIDSPQVVDPGPDGQFRRMRLQGAGLLEAYGSGSGLGAGPRLNLRLTPTFWRILDLLRAGGEVIGSGAE